MTAALATGSAVVLVLGLVRTKIVAVELGPVGIGSLALLVSLLSLLSVVLQLGLGASAIRELSAAHGNTDDRARDELRWALHRTMPVVGGLGAAGVVLTAGPLAAHVLGDASLEREVRLCGGAVFGTVWAAAAFSELYALQRAAQIARLQVIAAAVATAAVVVAALAGRGLLEAALLAPPVATALVVLLAVRRLPPRRRVTVARAVELTRGLARLAAVFLFNSLLATAGMLAVRLIVDAEAGRAATGEFQAAFILATTVVGFLFAALDAEYMPRLTASVASPGEMNRTADRHLQLMLLIATPLVGVLIVAAPLAIDLAYSDRFADAAGLLRIMLLGELARVAAWTVGYILVARAERRRYAAGEVAFNVALLGLVATLVPSAGVQAAAIAYAVAQGVHLVLAFALVRRASGFAPSRRSVRHLLLAGITTGALFAGSAALG